MLYEYCLWQSAPIGSNNGGAADSMGIQVKPVYDCKRASRRQLFGIYVDGLLTVICRTYPSWITSASH